MFSAVKRLIELNKSEESEEKVKAPDRPSSVIYVEEKTAKECPTTLVSTAKPLNAAVAEWIVDV
jgi:hypothetical protein